MQIISISNKAESLYFILKKLISNVKSLFMRFMVDALNLFKEKSNEEIKKVAFEIAALGGMGIDPNKQNYIIASIPEKRFSGNQFLAYMYVSWALAIPDKVQILGLPYENEYELAKKMN